MTKTLYDTGLETELQELYIQVTHWLQDISFLESETLFFRKGIDSYLPEATPPTDKSRFLLMINGQEKQLEALKIKISEFLTLIEPYISDLKKEMNFRLLEQYNNLQTELQELFADVRSTKKELFRYTKSTLSPANAIL
ncbi:hypothetical protein JN11_01917 [Mucilaginibacter frigoritolerans]|uniref:FlgN protein n=1 Tax=Mucilaginibacter frigoritolerans TaxID=652788 RepID=A0A562U689_9SPHI|nr:hypothetical protein [Mucilaginibacter frigoritolerans]TWJ00661.1 hypothetical protein JN11_01917 [Mucilaginibacter frigoritolerans]